VNRITLATAVLAVVVIGGAWMVSERAPDIAAGGGEIRDRGPAPVTDQTAVITVPSGASGDAIARQMEQAGVIADAGLFGTMAGLMGLENQLAAGEYEFTHGMPVADAIQRLRTGITVPSVTVTIPEGWRIEQMAALFEQRGLMSAADFLAAASATDYEQPWAQNRPPGSTLEGYLFPDTYFFAKTLTAHDVVARLLKTFDERFSAELRTAAQAQKLDLHQAVTLASIVEREAQVAEERPLIAAVFINRLREGMPLQADPTVQYAIAADPASVAQHGWWKRDLTVDDLKAKSPYSTYTNPGLPPGPIASPGLAALRAVAQPAPVKYLYFVAKGDGSHAFAETLAEHNRNVQRYQQ
jgi:UPF0755 protein